MRRIHTTALLALFTALAVPAGLEARQVYARPRNVQPDLQRSSTFARDQGYREGERIGQDHARRGLAFNFTNTSEYRNADIGYRSQYGTRDRYRSDFRIGFEQGYRAGYAANDYRNGRVGPPYGRARGYPGNGAGYPGNGGAYPGYPGSNYPGGGVYGPQRGYYDLAFDNGYNDGYDEGVKDGRSNHRNDPLAESRYRNGDHNYTRTYGSKDQYRLQYRDGFREGYERGYSDGRYYR